MAGHKKINSFVDVGNTMPVTVPQCGKWFT